MCAPEMKAVILVFGFFLEVILALDENCSTNRDCTTSNAICSDNKCNCGRLSYKSGDRCLSYATEYNDYCVDDGQCEWLGENSECLNNKCTCKISENYRWYQGKCQKFANKGEDCNDDIKCYNGYDLLSLTCDDDTGKCICANGFYERGGDCRYKSKGTDSSCAVDLDCDKILNRDRICVLGKCVVESTRDEANDAVDSDLVVDIQVRNNRVVNNLEEDSSCAKDADCADINHSVCSNNACTCIDNYYYYLDTTKEYVRGFETCTNDEDCKVPNTGCFQGSCLCRQGFFYTKDVANDYCGSGSCTAELGMPDTTVTIDSDSDCPIRPGKKMDKNRCACRTYWFNEDSNRQCIKTTLQETKSCVDNIWCRAMGPYAFCTEAGVCECNSFAQLNEETFYCEKINEPVDVCLLDSECRYNEKCVAEKCVCAEGFSKNASGNCLPNVGASCLIESCGYTENSICIGGICTCDIDYVSDTTRCLKMAEKLGESCSIADQCKNIEHAICSTPLESTTISTLADQSMRCICETDFRAINGTCWKNRQYGEICSSRLDCTMVLNDSIECRKSICQCPIGKKLVDEHCSTANILSHSYTLIIVLFVWLVGHFD